MANTYKTVILKKNVSCHFERVAGGTITPGHLLALNSSDQFIAHNVSGGNCAKIFAVENALLGKLITDTYVATNRVQAELFLPGDEVNAIIADNQNISIGDILVSNGDGTLIEQTALADISAGEDAPARTVGMALEAVTTSGAVARCRVLII